MLQVAKYLVWHWRLLADLPDETIKLATSYLHTHGGRMALLPRGRPLVPLVAEWRYQWLLMSQ